MFLEIDSRTTFHSNATAPNTATATATNQHNITFVAKEFNGRFEKDQGSLDTIFRFQVMTLNCTYLI